jgi:DNA-binding response OmpR family regulator
VPPRILVADDDPDTRTLLRRAAEAKGFVVEVARDGAEALEKARAAPPDLVLLDVMMPELDGRDVCRALRADPTTREVPILIVSARGDETDRRVGLELGADDYLAKPIALDQLMRKIEYLVWKRTHGGRAPG